MSRKLFDAVTLSNIPANPEMVGCYADGLYKNEAEARSRFPHAIIVPIAVSAGYNSVSVKVLDVENGDATPGQAPGWVQRQRAIGGGDSVYCNVSALPSVLSAFHAAGVAPGPIWVAHYDGVATIPAGAIAKQYLGDYNGYDLSIVADYWPGVDPKPSPPPVQTHKLIELGE